MSTGWSFSSPWVPLLARNGRQAGLEGCGDRGVEASPEQVNANGQWRREEPCGRSTCLETSVRRGGHAEGGRLTNAARISTVPRSWAEVIWAAYFRSSVELMHYSLN
jgi:hypothetical protein